MGLCKGYIGYGVFWDSGKENGNYYIIVGFRGQNSYQYYDSIFLISLWLMVPQMDLKLILVII